MDFDADLARIATRRCTAIELRDIRAEAHRELAFGVQRAREVMDAIDAIGMDDDLDRLLVAVAPLAAESGMVAFMQGAIGDFSQDRRRVVIITATEAPVLMLAVRISPEVELQIAEHRSEALTERWQYHKIDQAWVEGFISTNRARALQAQADEATAKVARALQEQLDLEAWEKKRAAVSVATPDPRKKRDLLKLARKRKLTKSQIHDIIYRHIELRWTDAEMAELDALRKDAKP